MKRILYIGIYLDGQTSKMRANKIRDILSDWEMDIINTDEPKRNTHWLWQSIGFRYKKGPLIGKVNRYVLEKLGEKHYDLIWVDKAIYLTRKTTEVLKSHTDKLVHFTPDPAFTFHRSKLFYESMPLYDYVITTKSYEMDDFVRMTGNKEKVLYATQGFDKNLHRPMVGWEQKNGVAFIGHYEAERVAPIEALLEVGIDVTLAGIKWEKFAKSHECVNLHYLGNGVFGEDYVKVLSSCLFAWGSVSKWIPEKHTTRTFEIPACKTALVTERNDELMGFFSDQEVIYYTDEKDMISRIVYYDQHRDELKAKIEAGYKAVTEGGYDYESIIKNLLKRVLGNGK